MARGYQENDRLLDSDGGADSEGLYIKVVAVGDVDCGKKSLLAEFSRKKRMDFHEKDQAMPMVIEKKEVVFSLWNTTGEQVNSEYSLKAYHKADVVLLCFSIGNLKSLENIQKIHLPEVRKHCPPKVPLIVVGNKKDLRSSYFDCKMLRRKKLTRPVQQDEGLLMTVLVDAYTYMECSALLDEGIQEVFTTAAMVAKPDLRKKKCTIQ